MSWEIRQGDALERLREMPDESVHCCVTSPPYWGLRDYGVDGQLGLEETPEQFVATMVEVFAEVRRVLRSDGTLWLNLGDTYAGGGGYAPNAPSNRPDAQLARGFMDRTRMEKRPGQGAAKSVRRSLPAGLKAKDLVGIPWMVAFALRAEGWWLRQEIIWHKRNGLPGGGRTCTKPDRFHEQLFLLAKSATYFYDAEAIREQATWAGQNRSDRGPRDSAMPGAPPHVGLRQDKQRGHGRRHDGFNDRWDAMSKDEQQALGRNKRSVWTIATKPFPDAHFATFPPDLVEPCIQAGTASKVCRECGAPRRRVLEVAPNPGGISGIAGVAYSKGTPETTVGNGEKISGRHVYRRSVDRGVEATCDHADDCGRAVVLDPFCGAATTGLVATHLGRDFVGIELNPEYVALGEDRIRRWENDPAGLLKRAEPVDGQGSIFDDSGLEFDLA
jgi:DNA modification methylase